MGNCMVVEEKVLKVMRPDGKILEYSTPILAHEVLSDFPGQYSALSAAASDSSSVQQHILIPDAKLLGGKLYFLVPIPCSTPQLAVKKKTKKKVRFCVPEVKKQSIKMEEESEEKSGGGVVRIKLVISKQELEELLKRGGVSMRDMVSHLQGQQQQRMVKKVAEEEEEEENDDDWKPSLESIPELDL
ncbi:Uncharacterized protein At1g66480 [Linum grandiflorum]